MKKERLLSDIQKDIEELCKISDELEEKLSKFYEDYTEYKKKKDAINRIKIIISSINFTVNSIFEEHKNALEKLYKIQDVNKIIYKELKLANIAIKLHRELYENIIKDLMKENREKEEIIKNIIEEKEEKDIKNKKEIIENLKKIIEKKEKEIKEKEKN